MDNSNREVIGPSGPSDGGNHRQVWLAVVLVVFALILMGRAWNDWHSTNKAKQSSADYLAFVALVRQADGIADPLQRCLHYPDLPGSHWDNGTTLAYCQLRNRHYLQLSQIDSLLQQGKADEVDRTYKGYLDAQLHDPKQSGLLDAAFYSAGFDKADANTRKIIDAWKQQSPNSAYALAASGMQYVDTAQKTRGNGWASDLWDDQVNGMRQQLALARQDLDRAVMLLPAVTPAYTSMVYLGALEGDEDYMNRAAKSGLTVDPANFALRGQMMNFAQPKWGSQFGGEGEQKSEAEALIANNQLLRMVVQYPVVYRAICDCGDAAIETIRLLTLAADKNVTYGNLTDLANEAYDVAPLLAVELYSESLRFNPADADTLQWRAQQMIKLGDVDGAIGSIAQAAQRFPDDNAVGTKLGDIYARTGHVKEAEDTFLAVLKRDPDNQQAMGELGDLYNHAGHQPEKAEALADTLISRHPENPAGYIVRACNQMDHNLPGRYDTIHYFIDHFGDLPEFKSQAAEMRTYLVNHPEKTGTG
jgi:tetratricopeptide (TPR) repeat protein